MILSTRSLDCAPLAGPIEARLSDGALRRIEPLQRTLLTPLDYGSVDEWRRAVNRATVDVFSSDAAMFQLDMDSIDLQYSEEFNTAHTSRYVSEMMPRFTRKQQLYRRAEQLKAGNRSMLWASDLKWLYDSAYFNELLRTVRAFDPLWVAAPGDQGRYPAMLHTYHDRPPRKHYFGAADVALIRAVQPALKAGIRTLGQVAASRESLAMTFDALGDGALIYDIEGHLVHRNRSLAGLVRTRRAEETIGVAGREMARALTSRETDALLRPHNATRVVSTRGSDYQLTAILLGEGVFTMRPAVLVTVSGGAPRIPDRDTLRQRFGLTRRQVDVALLLAERKTNLEMADDLCISEHTVRGHVEAVMGKLGVHDRRKVAAELANG